MTQSLAYLLFGIGAFFAYSAYDRLVYGSIYLSLMAIFLSVLFFLTPYFSKQKLIPAKGIESYFQNSWSYKRLLLGQIFIFCLALLFFYTIETQTKLDPLQYVFNEGQIPALLIQHPISLFLAPWLGFCVFGISLGYFSICLGRTPCLSMALFPRVTAHPGLFLTNYASVIFFTNTLISYTLIATLSLILILSGVVEYLGEGNIFRDKAQIFAGLGLILLMNPNTFLKANKWFLADRSTLGQILFYYLLWLLMMVVGLYCFFIYFEAGKMFFNGKLSKISVVGTLTETQVVDRLQWMIWGFWGMCTPWMASLIARTSLGNTILKTLWLAMIFPGCVFLLLFFAPNTFLQLWKVMQGGLNDPYVKIGFGLSLLLGIRYFLGHMTEVADIMRGCMPNYGRFFKKPFSDLYFLLTNIIPLYLIAFLLLGWVLLQMLTTLFALFITTLLFFILMELYQTGVKSAKPSFR